MGSKTKSRKQRNKYLYLAMLAGLSVWLPSCKTVYEAHHTPAKDLASEDSLVFVRPDYYTILGTRSIRDYIEVTYEESKRNAADLMTVQVGFRNRGGQRFYDLKGPTVALSIKTSFYAEPLSAQGPRSAPLYETNWQPLVLVRGDTGHFQVTCPVPAGRHYQITVSEILH